MHDIIIRSRLRTGCSSLRDGLLCPFRIAARAPAAKPSRGWFIVLVPGIRLFGGNRNIMGAGAGRNRGEMGLDLWVLGRPGVRDRES